MKRNWRKIQQRQKETVRRRSAVVRTTRRYYCADLSLDVSSLQGWQNKMIGLDKLLLIWDVVNLEWGEIIQGNLTHHKVLYISCKYLYIHSDWLMWLKSKNPSIYSSKLSNVWCVWSPCQGWVGHEAQATQCKPLSTACVFKTT